MIDQQPRVVHIMAGTSDIAGNIGPSTLKMIQGNVLGMTAIAMANAVRLIFASVPPKSDYPWRPGLDTVGPITALNAWLRHHARRVQAVYADYFSAMSDGGGGMRDGLSSDHVHPTAAG